jgi:superfamily I DNA/RNA helicase
MDHLIGLNSEQRKAVTETSGPLLIIAGAELGKQKP